MRIDAEQVRSQIQAITGDVIPELVIHTPEVVTSTNTFLWDLVDQGASEGTVVIAGEQQAGKGQRDRPWQSPPGGLYLSVALTPNQPATKATQLTLCSAWGIAQALRQQGIPVQIKWLNDLVIDGYKLGGILTETRLRGNQITQAVIGCGINWQNPVPPKGISLSMLPIVENQGREQSGEPIDSLEYLSAVVLCGLLNSYDYWQSCGIAAILPGYNQMLANRGKVITLDDMTYTILGVTADGSLRICPTLGDATAERLLPPGSVQLGYKS
jgi:BirA family biotin operon repressor/biotin-[acetyl-CoA-carboxylase] ligase